MTMKISRRILLQGLGLTTIFGPKVLLPRQVSPPAQANISTPQQQPLATLDNSKTMPTGTQFYHGKKHLIITTFDPKTRSTTVRVLDRQVKTDYDASGGVTKSITTLGNRLDKTVTLPWDTAPSASTRRKALRNLFA